MPSSQIVPMSALEEKLVGAAFCGEWVGIPELPTSLPVSQQADVTVEGAFLRKLLLGLIPAPATAGHNPHTHGIRLRGAIIWGEIDLSDCVGTKGSPLPPLLLEHCIIAGGEFAKWSIGETSAVQKIRRAINAANARLSRFSLHGCRVDGRVDLTGAKLEGPLEISNIAPLDPNCPCQIFARRCRISGSLIAKNTKLQIPAGLRTEFDESDYSLNLVNATIDGSAILQPGFVAIGGVDVRNARVSRDIWAEAAILKASGFQGEWGSSTDRDIWVEAAILKPLDEIAFRAQSLQCDGTIALRGTEDTLCEVEGRLDFIGATVGYLDLRGMHLSKSPNERKPLNGKDHVLRLELARVKGDLRLDQRFESNKEIRTIVEGPIDAFNLRVGGDLTLNYLNTSIDLTSSHIERNLSIKDTVFSGVVGDKTSVSAKKNYGLIARNITVGNDLDLDGIRGTVDLELSRIGGASTIRGAGDFSAPNVLDALNAKEVEVRGSVNVTGEFRPSKKNFLCFSGGSYQSGFYVGNDKNGFTIILGRPAGQDCAHDLTFSIENACIENNFYVGKVKVQEINGIPNQEPYRQIRRMRHCRQVEEINSLSRQEPVGSLIVSLRGLKVRVFEHKPSKWDRRIKLKLAGFEYDRMDDRLNFNDTEKLEAPTEAETPDDALGRVEFEESWCEALRRRLFGTPKSINESIKEHKTWLSRQVGYNTPDGYEPQPYEQLARALRNDGRFDDAKRITFQKLSLERETMRCGLTRLFFEIMERFFDYGLFPCKSVALFILFWLLGCVGFGLANSGAKPVLVLHSPPVSTFVLPEDKAEDNGKEPRTDGPPMAMGRTSVSDSGVVFERPCGHEVESWWYALDVFVPLLDIKQEDKCSISMRDEGFNWLWRGLSNIYEILGAIVTPIMLLSVSGLLRRYVEE